MSAACTSQRPFVPRGPPGFLDSSADIGFTGACRTVSGSYTQYPLSKRPNYAEVRGWSETLPGRNLPFDFAYKMDVPRYAEITSQPATKVDGASVHPEQLFAYARQGSSADGHRAMLGTASRLAQEPMPHPAFGSANDLRHSMQVSFPFKTMSEIDGSRVCHIDGIRRTRDDYRLTEMNHALPRLYGCLQPLYRHPNDYHHLGALEAGQKWSREVRDGLHNKTFSATVPRPYGTNSSAAWKYTGVNSAAMPGYSCFERQFPNIERSTHTIYPNKYKGFYNMS